MSRAERMRVPGVVYLSVGASLLLGLAFIFVRAPHPWGWEGFDHYHDLGLALARGERYPTTDYPWGYAYFLAFFYRVAGDRPWVPLTVQACLNAASPLLVYRIAAEEIDRRSAAVAAVLTGLCSFNTIYASTQSSDAICTVVFVAGVVIFARALASGRLGSFVASGLLAGLASQFRPNLLLFAPSLAAVAALADRSARRAGALAIYVSSAVLVTVPWAVHNYRLTGDVLPTSTHSGVQLWYGSLQTGRYLASRAYNPRSVFEGASFDYTSLANRSIVVEALCGSEKPAQVELVFWTDRARTPGRVAGTPHPESISFTIPGQPVHTVVYYYFAATTVDGGESVSPARGERDPYVFFVDDRHLSDLDAHDDLLDAFDFIRAARTFAWHEPLARPTLVDLDGDGRVTERDLHLIATALTVNGKWTGIGGPDVVRHVDWDAQQIAISLADGSSLRIPRQWQRRITDVELSGNLAAQVATGRRRVASLPEPQRVHGAVQCLREENVLVNEPFYRREPHMMRRYLALALDNIGRDRAGFVLASAFRAVRLFVVVGADDRLSTQQFSGAQRIYRAATLASATYLVLAAIGTAIAIRRGTRLWLVLTPILYVPATICFVLTNMRYTVTVQPFLFMLAALTVTAVFDRWNRVGTHGPPGAPDRAGTRTARQP